MKATEQYFPVVLYITLNKLVLTFDSWMKSYCTNIILQLEEGLSSSNKNNRVNIFVEKNFNGAFRGLNFWEYAKKNLE